MSQKLQSPNDNSFIICVEGPIGAGKTTLCAVFFAKQKFAILPELVYCGKHKMRQVDIDKWFIINNLRRMKLAQKIKKGNINVIVERDIISTIAVIYARNYNDVSKLTQWLRCNYGKFLEKYPCADYYIYLDIPPNISYERISLARKKMISTTWSNLAFVDKVHKVSKEILKEIDATRVFIIDANETPDKVYRKSIKWLYSRRELIQKGSTDKVIISSNNHLFL